MKKTQWVTESANNTPKKPSREKLTTTMQKIFSKRASQLLLATGIGIAWTNYYHEHTPNTNAILAEQTISKAIENAEPVRKNIEAQLQQNTNSNLWRFRWGLSTLIVFNKDTHQIETLFIPTEFSTEWIPQKWVGQILSPVTQDITGRTYSATYTSINGNVQLSKLNVTRTFGDHTDDADDYTILLNEEPTNRSVIGIYSPEWGKTIFNQYLWEIPETITSATGWAVEEFSSNLPEPQNLWGLLGDTKASEPNKK